MRYGLFAACLMVPLAAAAQVPASVQQAEQSLQDALAGTPITLGSAIFVTKAADGYGIYDARPDNKFAKNEPLHVYLEPVAFKYKQSADMQNFGFVIDFSILKGDVVLGGKEKFFDQVFASHHKSTEVMLNAAISLSGAPAGDYVLELVVHDKESDGTTRARLAFVITE